MSRQVVSLTLDNLDELPDRCRTCVSWELDPPAAERARRAGSAALEKEAWVSATLLEWGGCGLVLHVDGQPGGYALFAPPAYVPRSLAFATSPASADAVLLMTVRVADRFTGAGLGRVLVQGVVREAARRGVRAVEAFAAESSALGSSDVACTVPADFLRAVGFATARAHPRTPRMRLDLRSVASWREDVEYAWDRLRSTWQAPALTPR